MDTEQSLGDRIKSYESIFTSQQIDQSLPYVMRLDGHGFSKFTKGLSFDINLHNTFVAVTKLLMKEYNSQTGYTHSDEISLLFYPQYNDDKVVEPHFGGRIQKVISTAAAYCTMVFNNHLRVEFETHKEDYIKNEQSQQAYDRMISSTAYFDCRIFQIPNDAEMFSYMFWRSQVDCRRNHAFLLSRQHYSNRQLNGVNTADKLLLLREKGVIWEDEPAFWRRGSFIKRIPRMVSDVTRHDYVEIDVDLVKFNDDINHILKCKVYDPLDFMKRGTTFLGNF